MPRALRATVPLVVAVLAAEVAVLLLRPRSGVIAPAHVSASDVFSPAQIERARDFRNPQLALYGVGLALEAGLLVLLVARPPAALKRARRRPLVAGAATGAALSLALTAVTLPLGAISHARARDVGLATQDWGAWGVDVLRSAGIGAVIAGAGGALGTGLLRRFPQRWWIPGTAAVVLVAGGFIFAGPILLDPLFNRFTPLPAGPTRTQVLALARRAGVKVGRVYTVDASRRTSGANAYVTGLGRTKRVVLYDTLLERYPAAETRSVVAHELGHVHYSDVPRGLLYLLLVAPFGTWAVFRLTRTWSPPTLRGAPAHAALPALVLALGVVSTPMTWASNQLSRRVEARADSFALELTRDPRAFIGFEKRIVVDNVADPDPPGWVTFLLGTHPSGVDRIGAAEAFSRRRPPAGP